MINAIETVLLTILPWSFVAMTLALAVMWWTLDRRTTPTGPLGMNINDLFLVLLVKGVLTTWAMFILSSQVDASEIEWPFVTIALAGLALSPLGATWALYRMLRTYRDLAHQKRSDP